MSEHDNILTAYWGYQKVNIEIRGVGDNVVMTVIKKNFADKNACYYAVGQLVTFSTKTEELDNTDSSVVEAYVKKTNKGENILLLVSE